MASIALAEGCFHAAAAEPFTKIANDGTAVPVKTTQGSDPDDWACTRDERTGLVWEVKTRDRGLRDGDWIYTPYDGNPETNGGYPGYRDTTSGECVRALMDGGSCNTEAYVRAVNRSRLCGFSDWRLPTVAELVAVSGETSTATPEVTERMLPNTAPGWYWTGVERVGVTVFSRVILLPPAARPEFYDGSYLVLVVRGGEKPDA
jgi:hypothetical protein